jgi:hypothetical protein
MSEKNPQIKSKDRISQHGEVFTSEREVKNMLDLVKDETERIDSRFLEPACGTGNFLAEILKRKLDIVKKRYSKNKPDYEKYSFLAISNIYGVELLEDNVKECRDRLYKIFKTQYINLYKQEPNQDFKESIQFLLLKNILHGNALTMEKENKEPIIFSEWSFVTDNMIKRRDFRFDELLSGHRKQMSIFMNGWEFDEEIKAYIPLPIKEYPLVEYWRVQNA